MPEGSAYKYGMDFDTFFSIVDAMYDEILIYDGNYNIVYINQACARHYSCTPQHMIGRTFFDFVSDDWWGPSILPVVYEKKQAFAIRQKTYLGNELLTIAVPIFDREKNIRFVVMNVRDTVNEVDLYDTRVMEEYVPSPPREPVGESAAFQNVLAMAKRISGVDVTCILTGESGTGKTFLAKYIHSISPRKAGPFISLNCASIPHDLFESELFGYVKGAFTGASATGKKGLLAAADGGVLLLDEISELPLAAQAKLLHFLQEKEFTPVGSSTPVKVDVRVLAATNRNLKTMCQNGQFREDLYYRLSVVDLYIPPLRKRREDIVPLLYQFLNQFCHKYNVTRQFTEGAIEILARHDWPGNVRELQHMVERLVVTGDSVLIDVPQLPTSLFGISDEEDAPPAPYRDDRTYDAMMASYEAVIVRDAYRHCGSSRKMAEYLSISQTKANKLIQKHIKEKTK